MPERIVLVGAGDHGRGVLEILRACARAGQDVQVVGFVDDAPPGPDLDGVPVLGDTSWLVEHLPGLGAAVILAMASPGAKRRLVEVLRPAAPRYGRAIHPRADLAPSVSVGEGSVIGSGVVVVYETVIGAHVTVNLNTTIGHHVHVGDFSTIAPGVNVLGKVQMGEGCQLHANATILPSVRLGADVSVGAGSVVLADAAAGLSLFGNPARPIPAVRP